MNIWCCSPQIWTAYGLEWRFEYNSFSAKRTVSANGFVLDIPVKATTKFASPRLWLDDWAKKNRKRLPPEPEGAVNLELDLFPPQSVRVELVDDLTPEEERQRLFWERKVERAFYEAGTALKELRDRRLYRSTHKTFEEYCRDRFGYSRRKMDYLISGSEVFENLQTRTNDSQSDRDETRTIGSQSDRDETRTIGSQSDRDETRTIGSQILPISERQVRPLTQLEPDQQREVWQQAVEAAGGKVPSGRIVKDIVQRIRERTKIPIPYRVGDVCEILIKDNPDLRGLGGCWCIVIKVREFSCLVRTWNGEYTVREENLRDLQYSPDHRQNMQQLSDRLVHLRSLGEEETVRAILETLGSLKRPYLNPWEEKLLEFLEGYNAL
ncbi:MULTISPECIES: hypothetical protein [unclassified Microcystis]|uniref:Uncharacterized protein n=1 Tax=Microcystis flos-aquae Mf_QC_C_20070823_S10D TaxID=2486236 RepID=A0A552KHR7_9CHRO|nr:MULTISPECIES: hypothetical protein [unclassified Microcystis]MCA2815703.1 hypothetical protein [Microcystis sp. M085S1]MCA2856671.1 hypothetical protein [Microcystis sp. M065S1]TRT99465.1 MAG: hypothetical protein EWV65_07940 [Microcystis flos-aquae Ma_QC_C_20070823_S18D]TRV07315.1 MAG: hypothetical protein EWV45_20135 [Microcystis flos-aquae Mf_QC_C_20070823_S10D]TRV23719.1 MAG: hypothetical protein EWV72_12885 [Microcystis flos-aquae Mf_QC_C_20070823_S10]TRV35981.1 MAG: hypothetical prot